MLTTNTLLLLQIILPCIGIIKCSIIADEVFLMENALMKLHPGRNMSARMLACMQDFCPVNTIPSSCPPDACKPNVMIKNKCAQEMAQIIMPLCARTNIEKGLSHFNLINSNYNHVYNITLTTPIGPSASSYDSLHGNFVSCSSSKIFSATSTCTLVASGDINSVFFRGPDISRPSIDDYLFSPVHQDTKCSEPAVFSEVPTHVSRDGSYDNIGYSLIKSSLVKGDKTLCSHQICDVCVVPVYIKYVGSCSMSYNFNKGFDVTACNKDVRKVAFHSVAHHNVPTFTSEMFHSSFVFLQIYYYISSLFPTYRRMTSPSEPIDVKVALDANKCQTIHYAIPESMNYDISIKCGSESMSFKKHLDKASACYIYSIGQSHWFIGAQYICQHWVLIKYAVSTVLLALVVIMFSYLYIDTILMFILIHPAAPIAYLLYLILPNYFICNNCKLFWSPFHVCTSVCLCGSNVLNHDCVYSKKRHDPSIEMIKVSSQSDRRVPVGFAKSYRGKNESSILIKGSYNKANILNTARSMTVPLQDTIRTFLSRSNGYTWSITQTLYFMLLYIAICYLTPSTLAYKCCGYDVSNELKSLSSSYPDGYCTLSASYDMLQYSSSTKTAQCAYERPRGITDYNLRLERMGLATVFHYYCITDQNCLLSETFATMLFIPDVSYTKAATQCLITGSQNQISKTAFVMNCKNLRDEMLYQKSLFDGNSSSTPTEVSSHNQTGQLSPIIKKLIDSLPLTLNPKNNQVKYTPDIPLNPSSVFLTSSSNGILTAQINLLSTPGSTTSFQLHENSIPTPVILTFHIKDVRNHHSISYEYTSCQLQITSMTDWRCHGDNNRCLENLKKLENSVCTTVKHPSTRWETLPECTIFTEGEICTACAVTPKEDTCMDVYKHEYVTTEYDICVYSAGYGRCSTIVAGDIMTRQYISIESISIPTTSLEPRIAIDKNQHCYTGDINDIASDNDMFGYPQFNKSRHLESYECDIQVNYAWSDTVYSTIESCTIDRYHHLKNLRHCGRVILSENPPYLYVTPISSGSVTISLSIPAKSLTYATKSVKFKNKRCNCEGCLSCLDGIICSLSFESSTSGLVMLVSDAMDITTSSISMKPGLNNVDVHALSANPSKKVQIMFKSSGSVITTFDCPAIHKITGNAEYHTEKKRSIQPVSFTVPIVASTSFKLSNLLDYINPLHLNFGIDGLSLSWVYTVIKWMIFIFILSYIIIISTRVIGLFLAKKKMA